MQTIITGRINGKRFDAVSCRDLEQQIATDAIREVFDGFAQNTDHDRWLAEAKLSEGGAEGLAVAP